MPYHPMHSRAAGRGTTAARRLALALGLAAALSVAGCTGTNAVSQDVNGGGFQLGDAALRWLSPGDRGAPVSGVDGELLDGKRFDLSAWQGHVVVVNFWAHDCGPCRGETQTLNEVYETHRAAGVEFLGVDIRDDRVGAENFERARHVGYPSLYDEDGTIALHFPGLPPNATPTTIVLDRQGRIAARQSGSILYTQLRAVVGRVVAEPA
jgi:thiol-disulfide isomerase/thioredoxin